MACLCNCRAAAVVVQAVASLSARRGLRHKLMAVALARVISSERSSSNAKDRCEAAVSCASTCLSEAKSVPSLRGLRSTLPHESRLHAWRQRCSTCQESPAAFAAGAWSRRWVAPQDLRDSRRDRVTGGPPAAARRSCRQPRAASAGGDRIRAAAHERESAD